MTMKVFFAAFLLLYASCNFLPCDNLEAKENESPPPGVSIFSLLGNPQLFDERVILTGGWISYDNRSGRYYLWPSLEHLQVNDFTSAIPVQGTSIEKLLDGKKPSIASHSVNQKFVLITGRFLASNLIAPANLGVGELVDCTHIDLND